MRPASSKPCSNASNRATQTVDPNDKEPAMSDYLGQLDQWSACWSESLWRATLQGGIAIAAAWAITHYCRFLSARVRCWVWRVACVKLLVALVWSQPLDLPM